MSLNKKAIIASLMGVLLASTAYAAAPAAPSVSAPTVNAPSVSAPTVSAPSVNAPAASAAPVAMTSGMEKCMLVGMDGKGLIKEKMADCAGASHSCAGQNKADDAASWLLLPAGTCTKINGGTVSPK